MTKQLLMVEETWVPRDNHHLLPSQLQLSHMPLVELEPWQGIGSLG